MSEPIDLAQAGIEVTTAAHLASPSLLGEYVAGLNSGVRVLGPTRAKAIRDFVVTLDMWLSGEALS